ncbi:MAG: hypothetical protein N0E44_22875 [Candidatus Thiodiazotropha lotti]|nr:hypothetical protein [Candidatus Thiodiazotropha lotti]MCW4222714.1 hypothetical protein [Candidatus Thiodiazotropha lotti]
MSKTRIYTVTDTEGTTNLVRAVSRQGAIGHVARSTFTAEVASQERLVELVGKGVSVEDATNNTDDVTEE